jgi:uncharacterized membrane protein (DUF485 family)
MDEEKKKEGVSVKEIEAFTKKHRFEVVFTIAFVLACFFGNFVFFGPAWSVILATAGGIIGLLLPQKVETFGKKVFEFLLKQEQMIQLILGIVILILSIFLPLVIFLALGLAGGVQIRNLGMPTR